MCITFVSFRVTYVKNPYKRHSFLFEPLVNFFLKNSTRGLNASKRPCPLMKRLTPPLLVDVSLPFSLSLAQLLLGIVIITIIVITTFEVTVSTIMET